MRKALPNRGLEWVTGQPGPTDRLFGQPMAHRIAANNQPAI
jgi:hypothetical protein